MSEEHAGESRAWSNYVAVVVLAVCFSVSLWRVWEVQKVEQADAVATIRVVHWQLEAGFREAFDDIARRRPRPRGRATKRKMVCSNRPAMAAAAGAGQGSPPRARPCYASLARPSPLEARRHPRRAAHGRRSRASWHSAQVCAQQWMQQSCPAVAHSEPGCLSASA